MVRGRPVVGLRGGGPLLLVLVLVDPIGGESSTFSWRGDEGAGTDAAVEGAVKGKGGGGALMGRYVGVALLFEFPPKIAVDMDRL